MIITIIFEFKHNSKLSERPEQRIMIYFDAAPLLVLQLTIHAYVLSCFEFRPVEGRG